MGAFSLAECAPYWTLYGQCDFWKPRNSSIIAAAVYASYGSLVYALYSNWRGKYLIAFGLPRKSIFLGGILPFFGHLFSPLKTTWPSTWLWVSLWLETVSLSPTFPLLWLHFIKITTREKILAFVIFSGN